MRVRVWLVVLTLVYTLLDAAKPLEVDDAAYVYYARQIAEHPLDPYGFDVLWYERPDPANTVLAPPVFLYWWAASVRLFGERPLLWKLWLFPVALLFVGSLYALFQRFARRHAWSLTAMTVFSPTFLPSMNLMLDVPALALGLLALVQFMRAADRGGLGRAVGAGVAAGLAMQAKYTGFLVPAAMMLYGASALAFTGRRRRWVSLALALVAAAVAIAVFAAWEAFVAWRYGESHFLREYREGGRGGFLTQIVLWSGPLLLLLGGLHGAGALLALAALGRRPGTVMAAGALMLAGFAVIAFVPPSLLGADTSGGEPKAITPAAVVFAIFGAAVVATLLLVTCRLVIPGQWREAAVRAIRVGQALLPASSRARPAQALGPPLGRWRHRDIFLTAWLLLELMGYFGMTPFGAARRVMGIILVSTLIAGRLASLTCREANRVRVVRGVAVFGVGLGLLFYAADFRDACAARLAAEEAADWVRARVSSARIWYVGHWGFQFYAERAGMQAAVADDADRPLQAGDWLVVPDARMNQQMIWIDPKRLKLEGEVAVSDGLPLRLVQEFYGTAVGTPMQYHRGPRVKVAIYRVHADFVPTPRRPRRGESQ